MAFTQASLSACRSRIEGYIRPYMVIICLSLCLALGNQDELVLGRVLEDEVCMPLQTRIHGPSSNHEPLEELEFAVRERLGEQEKIAQ
jgi:hypothetical protein